MAVQQESKGEMSMCQQDVEKVLQQNGKRITRQRKILLYDILNGKWKCCKGIYYEAV